MIKMRPSNLTEEQQHALEPHIRLIEAGPGAGKTETVTARYRQRISEGHTVAFLSFTNAAVDTARNRCHDQPNLLAPPQFVGTFDQFFHRFVVTPYVQRERRVTPQYLNSWDDLPQLLSHVDGIRLSRFSQDENDIWGINNFTLKNQEKIRWERSSGASQKHIISRAAKRIEGLYSNHIYDATKARQLAWEILRAENSRALALVSKRFSEIIIDEFQDCDALEQDMLRLFEESGVHIVAVADPDQAIYEFRNSTPEIYTDYRKRINESQIARLNTCFRSTPAICSVVSSLRTIGKEAIRAAPDKRVSDDYVHVVVGNGVEAGEAALGIIRSRGIKPQQTCVVAHKKSLARGLVHAGKEAVFGSSQMAQLLEPLAILRTDGSGQRRLAAIQRVERFLLGQFDWSQSPGIKTKQQQLDHIKMPPDLLRQMVGRLLTASYLWNKKEDWKESLILLLNELSSAISFPLLSNLTKKLPIQKKVWDAWQSSVSAANRVNDTVPWSHVHAVKGGEFDAVVLAVTQKDRRSPTHVLDDWEEGGNSEQRRVLYVGASRARKMLVLVVQKNKKNQLEKILNNDGVPFQTVIL